MQRVKLKQIGKSTQDERANTDTPDSPNETNVLQRGDEEGTPDTSNLSLDKIKEKLTKNALIIAFLIGGYLLLSENSTGGSGITVVK